MKLYTRSGDDGTTGLFGGQRVGKDDPRIEAYGTIDELNSAIGLALAACDSRSDVKTRLTAILKELQSRLFDIGADMATPAGSPHESKVSRITSRHIAESERWIDEIDSGNDPMKNFVLPGGSELAARLHVARAICRRAERLMVALSKNETMTPEAIIYINRISDLLFAMARRANKDAGVPDIPWVPGKT